MLLLASLGGLAQLDTAIVRTFGGPYYEEGRQIIECSDGGYAIIGTTGSDQPNNTNFYLLRLDEELNCMWNKNYGGSEVEWGYSIVEDASGNFVLCGYTNSFGAGGYDILVYKVNPEGAVIWQNTFGGSDWDFAYKMIAHPENGYLICGKTYSYGNGGSDAYLLHISEDGNLLNDWTYGGEGDDEFRDIAVKDNSSFFLVGSHFDNDEAVSYGNLKLVNQEGQQIWNFNLSAAYSRINSLTMNNSNIYYCGSKLNSSNLISPVFGVINYDGIQIFDEDFDINGDFEYTSIYNYENDVVICGITNAFGSGNNNGFFYRRAQDGSFVSGITIGAEKLEFLNAIVSNDKYYLVGNAVNENYEIEQLPVMVYPDFTFSASSHTEWNNESCFYVSLDQTIRKTTGSKNDRYSIYTLSGHLVDVISINQLETEYITLSDRKKSLLVSKKVESSLLVAVPKD